MKDPVWSEIFDYREGELFWKIKPSFGVHQGSRAGYTDSKGYRRVKFQGKHYKVHKIVYEMHYGSFSKEYRVDHKNTLISDNKIENLRLSTGSQNAANRNIFKNNTSGFKGVSLHKQTMKFCAGIRLNGKRIHLGLFDTSEEAYSAYKMAANTYHGEFART